MHDYHGRFDLARDLPDPRRQALGEVAKPVVGTSTVTKGGKVRTVILLEPEEKRALKVAAAERDCSASDIVREALRRYLGLG